MSTRSLTLILFMIGLQFSTEAYSFFGFWPFPVPPLAPAYRIPNGHIEPTYCTLENFLKHEIPLESQGLVRAHAYRLGSATLVGLGVGTSDLQKVMDLSTSLSDSTQDDGFCTWYFHHNSKDAERTFNWRYVTNPKRLPPIAAQELYSKIIGPELATRETSFLSCLKDHHYLAMGCHGMKHRGPSVFALLLAYSGCTPEHATEIAHHVWSLNGVPSQVRLAIAIGGFNLGLLHDEDSRQIRSLLSQEPKGTQSEIIKSN